MSTRRRRNFLRRARAAARAIAQAAREVVEDVELFIVVVIRHSVVVARVRDNRPLAGAFQVSLHPTEEAARAHLERVKCGALLAFDGDGRALEGLKLPRLLSLAETIKGRDLLPAAVLP